MAIGSEGERIVREETDKIGELIPWGEMVPPEPMNAALERTMNKINELVKAVNERMER